MELKIKDRIISGDLKQILEKLKIESHKPYLFKDMKISGDSLMVNCPYHSGGKESKPSCGFVNTRFGKSEWGRCHCFACGRISSLPQLVSDLFGSTLEFGEEWLYKNFSGDKAATDFLAPIELDKKENYMDESILLNYDYYHPYMWKRKLTKEVVDKYRVGYDPLRKCLTFPVWDAKGRLKMVTTRSVDTKKFYIQKEQDKDIYLLNFIIKENVETVFVTESQINALTLESYGYRAIALLGTGSYEQYKILKKSGIRHYILALDSDKAGRLGTKRFINNAKLSVIIDVVDLPSGYDVNDLTREEFEKCPIITSFEWLQKYGKDLD